MTITEHATAQSILFNERNIYAVVVDSSSKCCVYKLVRTDNSGGSSSNNYVFQEEAGTVYHLGDESNTSNLHKMFEKVIDGTQCGASGSSIYEFDDYLEYLQWCINKEVAHRGRQG